MCPPGAHLPNRVMASRHSTGVTYSLARNSCLSTSMRLECAICGGGVEFPRASARRCLTFPHGVYSAHRFSSQSFTSPTRCTGFADSPPGWRQAAKATTLSWGTADPPRFASWSVWPDFPTVLGWTTLDFVELCNISSYILQGQVLCKRVHPRTASFPLFTQGGARKFLAFHWTLKWIFHNRANYFHPGANTDRSHGSRDS